jgi:hypothetical protein
MNIENADNVICRNVKVLKENFRPLTRFHTSVNYEYSCIPFYACGHSSHISFNYCSILFIHALFRVHFVFVYFRFLSRILVKESNC